MNEVWHSGFATHTPLSAALDMGYLRVVILLLRAGADVFDRRIDQRLSRAWRFAPYGEKLRDLAGSLALVKAVRAAGGWEVYAIQLRREKLATVVSKATGHKLPRTIYLEIASFVEIPGGDTDDEDDEDDNNDSSQDGEDYLSSSEDECE